MVEKTTALIITLLVALTITGAGWIIESSPEYVETFPSGIYNWTEYFHGYQAYLDKRIFSSIIRSSSMSPTFTENDLILWVSVNTSELRVGDIILFKHPTMDFDNVAHRIVEIQFDGGKYQFRTKGDNFSGLDRYYIPEANVHGLVIGVVYHDNSR